MRALNASEFKAKCLKILDDVARSGEIVTILKRGRPVAELHPPTSVERGYPQDSLRGTVGIRGDIVSPVIPPSAWDAERGEPT